MPFTIVSQRVYVRIYDTLWIIASKAILYVHGNLQESSLLRLVVFDAMPQVGMYTTDFL